MQLRCAGLGAPQKRNRVSLPQLTSRGCKSRRQLKVLAKRNQAQEKQQAEAQQWQASSPEDQENNPYSNPYGNQGQYYQQYPYYTPPPPPSSGPPYGWIAFGAVLAVVGSKVYSFFFTGGGPQANVMNFMMKQAMKSTGAQGGFPDLKSNAGGFPPAFPGGFPSPNFPSSPNTGKPSSPVVDTQAKDVPTTPTGSSSAASTSASASTSAPTEADSKPGAKFQEMKSRRRRREQPTSASFVDVEDEEKASSTASANATISPDQVTSPSDAQSSGNGSDSAQIDMLETFLQDPEMQKLLYQYLPENMRNKETFEWMLKNPEYRAQLEQMLQQQGANLNPEVYKQMQGINSKEVTDQLAQFGMTPADVVQKIMGDPELAQAFSTPRVQQAVMELQNDSMAILKYQNDPEVMMVFEKMSQLFPEVKP